MDQLDKGLDIRFVHPLLGCRKELFGLLDTSNVTTKGLRQQYTRSAPTGAHVEHLRVRAKSQTLTEQPDLGGARRILEFMLALNDMEPPRHGRSH